MEYSILMPGTVVKAGASISYAIVAEDAVVEAGAWWARLRTILPAGASP